MSRPLIAISARPRLAGEVAGWPNTPATVVQNLYLEALWRAGGDEAVVAPRMTTDEEARAYLARFDGLILVGGGDVDPTLFGQERHPKTYGVFETSDSLEIALAKAAIELGIPALFICRGMQVLNVALGGTLVQHIAEDESFEDHGQPGHGFALHPVDVTPGSLLAKTQGGRDRISQCWSYHHQAIDELGRGLTVSARSSDGAIEGVELDDPQQWAVAIQWHPERTAATDAAQQALFDELVRQAAARQRGIDPGEPTVSADANQQSGE